MKSLKVPQEQPSLTQGQEAEPKVKSYRKLFLPSFKALYPYDVQLAKKKNLFFLKVKTLEKRAYHPSDPPLSRRRNPDKDFESKAYQKLINRNLKYIKGTNFCSFLSRPSSSLVHKVLQKEYYERNLALTLENRIHDGKKSKAIQSELQREFNALLLFVCRNRISIEHLMLYSFMIQDESYQRKYFGHFKNIISLKINHDTFMYLDQDLLETAPQQYDSPDQELNKISSSLSTFKNLQKISLDFSNAMFDFSQEDTEISSCQSFLCEIIKILSQVSTLNAIEIKMRIINIEKKAQKMKPFLEKLTQLKYLKLDFYFEQELKEAGKIYATLLPLPTLRHLSINQTTLIASFNCSDLAAFISSFKNLETLEFTCNILLFDQYNVIFQAIQKLKSLTKLAVLQEHQFNSTFAYGLVFKTLGILKKLTSIKIDLGYHFDGNEVNSLAQHLLKHPTLKEADFALQVFAHLDCNISEELYANIYKLREKLQRLKILLRFFSVDSGQEMRRIIVKNQYDRKDFDCQWTTTQYLAWSNSDVYPRIDSVFPF